MKHLLKIMQIKTFWGFLVCKNFDQTYKRDFDVFEPGESSISLN